MSTPFPLGKLPPDILADLLSRYQPTDPRVIVGPRPGEDAAVLNVGGPQYLIAKTDPITFAADEIGWYAVNVNANDIAATGGTPQWFMATLLLPPGTDAQAVESIYDQMGQACATLKVSLVGGHTEITHGIDRPIIVGIMLGQVDRDRMVETGGAQAGDVLLVTKGIPIEGISLIVREKADRLGPHFSENFLKRSADFLHEPGISVVKDARVAQAAGRVHAMHDPTEGGLATGLWEMADASAKELEANPRLALLEEGELLCEVTGLDPLGVIASGALLLAVHPDDAGKIKIALAAEGIAAFEIGTVHEGPAAVIDARSGKQLPRPVRDEIAKLYE
jgi:hydrogenase maturation factor